MDIACIVNATLLMCAALELAPWWAFVESAANPADGGLRGDFEMARKVGIELEELGLPPWPTCTRTASA